MYSYHFHRYFFGILRFLTPLSAVAVLVCPCAATNGDQPDVTAGGTPIVAVKVDGQPIYQGEARTALQRIPQYRKLSPQDRSRAEAKLLDQLIDQRLVLRYLERHDQTASSHLVDAEVTDLTARLKQRKISLSDYLKECGVTEKALRTELAWRMSWKQYVDRHVTDEVLQGFFKKNRKQFDGTRVRVSHILFAADDAADPAVVEPLKTKAASLRRKIQDGQVTFAAAAAEHSASPTGSQGGDVGFITRHGEMAEAFAAAAFALEANEISEPVVTPFGVHLIRCTDIEPGKRQWTDVVDELRSAVVQRGFRRIADKERETAKIDFTGSVPYFVPGTGELVLPR